MEQRASKMGFAGIALLAHQPLGGISRARLVVYKTLAERRLRENGRVEQEATAAFPA